MGFFLLVFALLAGVPQLFAQIQVGTVQGMVADITSGVIPGASVTLNHPVTGFHRVTVTDRQGEFLFNNIPFASYTLRIEASGFESFEQIVELHSNLPEMLQVQLDLARSVQNVTVSAPLLERASPTTQTNLDETLIQRLPSSPNGGLQNLISKVAGWSTENNGLLHVRGVDNGFLFVIDGIPLNDRIDTLSAGGISTEMIQSVQVINGHISAEYGYASGAVINVIPKSGIDSPWGGSLGLGGGTFRSGEASYTLRGNIERKFGLFVANSLSGSSERYLDPVDPRNFNNRGGVLRFQIRSDWHPSTNDILLANVSLNGSDFRVPNTLDQELAGQRQRQELRDNSESLTWQHIWSSDTVTNLGWYRRSYQAELFPSSNDTPLSARQQREHVRQGMLLNVTHSLNGHSLQAGADVQRVTPRELFSFFVTDLEKAEEADLSPSTLLFDSENPFLFQDRVTRGQASWYIQDRFSPLPNLTVSAGLRFDHTALLVSDSQFSPRLGAVYYSPKTRTAVRGSYNRLFMPPQVENLLLSSSEQARQLSPFTTPEGKGGARVQPESQHAFEIGFSQDISNFAKFDTAYWWRLVHNYADPNVFFGTTVVFPNAVDSGRAQGLDVRIDVPEKNGWSGYLSYSNSRVFQIGPINGGLFLEEEVLEIVAGTRFTPDHDQRNVGTLSITYRAAKLGILVTVSGRHESGSPLEVDKEELNELMERPGAELVNFDRGRVKPRTLFDLSFGKEFLRTEPVTVSWQFDVRNLTDEAFAYNFGNPFSGTHFGYPRLWSTRIKFDFN